MTDYNKGNSTTTFCSEGRQYTYILLIINEVNNKISRVLEGLLNGPHKKRVAKFRSNFVGLKVSFFRKKPSQESRILKTKEIGGKASQARKNMPCLGVSQSLALTIRYPYWIRISLTDSAIH